MMRWNRPIDPTEFNFPGCTFPQCSCEGVRADAAGQENCPWRERRLRFWRWVTYAAFAAAAVWLLA
jgi:hypothetical protein